MSLAEQLYLIAFDPARGKATANPPLALSYGLAGASLMDDPSTDPREVKKQVKKLAGRKAGVQRRVEDELLSRGVLAVRDASVLGIKLRRFDLVDAGERDQAVAALRAALTGDAPVEQSMRSLAALAGACGLIDRVVERGQRKAARARASAITKQDPTGSAVSGAVQQEVEAAVMAGVIAAVAASSVTSSGHH